MKAHLECCVSLRSPHSGRCLQFCSPVLHESQKKNVAQSDQDEKQDHQRDLESQSYQAAHAMNSPAPFRMQNKAFLKETKQARTQRETQHIYTLQDEETDSK